MLRARHRRSIDLGRFPVVVLVFGVVLWSAAALAGEALVRVPEAVVRSAPYEVAPVIARLRAGDRLPADDGPQGAWRRVRLADGRFGLVHDADVEVTAVLLPTYGPLPCGGETGVYAIVPPRLREFSVGLGIGADADWLSIDGGPRVYQIGNSTDFSYKLELGYTRKLSPMLGLSALLRGGTWSDDWSASAGEHRERMDLRVSPEIRTPHGGLKLSLGLGPTLAGIEPAKHWTVHESYGPGVGFNVAGRLTGTIHIPGEQSGLYAAADLSFFWIWIRHQASVDGDPSLQVDERFLFSGYSLCLNAGYTHSW